VGGRRELCEEKGWVVVGWGCVGGDARTEQRRRPVEERVHVECAGNGYVYRAFSFAGGSAFEDESGGANVVLGVGVEVGALAGGVLPDVVVVVDELYDLDVSADGGEAGRGVSGAVGVWVSRW
jgi:hypothetical protein